MVHEKKNAPSERISTILVINSMVSIQL